MKSFGRSAEMEKKMDGLIRNLRYWSRTIGQMVLIIVAMVFGISIVTELEEIGNIPLAFCVTMSRYRAMYMIFIMGILGLTVINTYMPFTLSMGSTRRDSFIGMEIMLHLAGLFTIGIIIGAGIFAGRQVNVMLFVSSILLLTASVALCNLVGWVYLRFGKTVGLTLYILLVIVGTFGIGMLAAVNEEGGLEKLGMPHLPAAGWGMLAVAAAIAADTILILLYRKEVKKLEVRV